VPGGDRALGVLGQAARRVEVGDEDVDPAAAQRRPDGPVLVRAAGHADAPGHPLEVGRGDAHHALVERRVEHQAVFVEEPQADVADRAGAAELVLLGLAERVAALPQQRRRLQAADADQGEVEFLPRLHDVADGGVLDQRAAQRRAADQRGRGQQHRLRAGDGGQVADELVRLDLHARVAVTADDLDHPGQGRGGPGRHGLGGGEQRRAPRRHPEHLAAGQRRVQVLRRGGAERRDDLAPGAVGVDDDGIPEAVLLLDRLLEVGVDAGRQGDHGTDDTDVAGLTEQPGHPRL
jgi:hypothetical protein